MPLASPLDRESQPPSPLLCTASWSLVSIESKRGSRFLDLTRFLDANRSPPPDQVRGHASLENALGWILLRKLGNFFCEAVETCQPFVFFLRETAIRYSLRGGRLGIWFGRENGVVAIQPFFRCIVDLETGLQLGGNR